MEDVIPLSPVAANQDGRVYALKGVDGEPEMAEFARTSQTGTPTFERARRREPDAVEFVTA